MTSCWRSKCRKCALCSMGSFQDERLLAMIFLNHIATLFVFWLAILTGQASGTAKQRQEKMSSNSLNGIALALYSHNASSLTSSSLQATSQILLEQACNGVLPRRVLSDRRAGLRKPRSRWCCHRRIPRLFRVAGQ